MLEGVGRAAAAVFGIASAEDADGSGEGGRRAGLGARGGRGQTCKVVHVAAPEDRKLVVPRERCSVSAKKKDKELRVVVVVVVVLVGLSSSE